MDLFESWGALVETVVFSFWREASKDTTTFCQGSLKGFCCGLSEGKVQQICEKAGCLGVSWLVMAEAKRYQSKNGEEEVVLVEEL